MLLRSSSTPVLGSLLSSVPESPNNNQYETPKRQSHSKLSFQHSGGSPHFSAYSCSSSPAGDISQRGGFRRAQSEGNLQTLGYASCCNDDNHFHSSNLGNKNLSGKPPKCLTLETIPSFSCHNMRSWYEDDEEEESDFEYESDGEEALGNTLVETEMSSVISREDVGIKKAGIEESKSMVYEEMYLAKGLGIVCDVGGFWGGGGGGGGGECNPRGFGGDCGDGGGHDVEDYYKRMVEENPGNPLFLRNYAQFLYQTKHDLQGAEEYYSRAILADPGDGEILTHYAKLVWELHGDQDRASSYFERAIQASPEDSHVHAAYASFLWDVDDEDDVKKDPIASPPQLHKGHVASVGA